MPLFHVRRTISEQIAIRATDADAAINIAVLLPNDDWEQDDYITEQVSVFDAESGVMLIEGEPEHLDR
jgi:hypothetical protein